MKKKGQFYLIAAIVIAIVMFSTFSLTNRSSKKEYSIVYDLSDELDLEGNFIKEYGIMNKEDLSEVFEDFLNNYSEYIQDPTLDIYFVYGSTGENGELVYHQIARTTSGEFTLGGTSTRGSPQIARGVVPEGKINEGIIKLDYVGRDNNKIDTKIKIKEGEYFYYVITQQALDESVYTVDSQNKNEK